MAGKNNDSFAIPTHISPLCKEKDDDHGSKLAQPRHIVVFIAPVATEMSLHWRYNRRVKP